LVLPLKQGAGVAGRALVKTGERMKSGQPLTEIPQGQLGSIIHAPADAVVESVTDKIVLTRTK
jgi:Na+-translocating ferredoxin:NAD+ oxidoreductase RnfC subunit